MKIKNRLLLTHGLLVVLCLLIVFINLISQKGMKSDGVIINNTGKLRAISYNMSQIANVINNTGDYNENLDLRERLKLKMGEYEDLLLMLENSEERIKMDMNHDETTIKLDELSKEWYEKFKPSYLQILEDKSTDRAYAQINGDIDLYVDNINKMVTLYSIYSTNKVMKSLSINAGLIIFIIAVTLYSFKSINIGIRNPIKILMGELEELSIIDGDLSEKLNNMDIDEISKMTEYFNAMKYDQLTKALNRKSGLAKLNKLLEYDKENYKISLCFMDINDLKIVNDELGHKVGDDLIVTVANTIRKNIYEDDFLIRMGGDEFMVVFKGIGEEDSEKVWDRINNQYKIINEKEDKSYVISVSHGIIGCDNHEKCDVDLLIKEADEKMYIEKRYIKEQIKGKIIKQNSISKES